LGAWSVLFLSAFHQLREIHVKEAFTHDNKRIVLFPQVIAVSSNGRGENLVAFIILFVKSR
jgi:hypothetical protein